MGAPLFRHWMLRYVFVALCLWAVWLEAASPDSDAITSALVLTIYGVFHTKMAYDYRYYRKHNLPK